MPSTLRDVVTFSQRRTAPHPRYSGLLFALISLFLFQIWEAFLRFLLQRDAYVVCFVLGLAALATAIFMRQKRLLSVVKTDKRLGSLTLALMCLGFSVMLNSWGTLIFVPWVYFRARFLPRRLG
jgi:hypothetical protein